MKTCISTASTRVANQQRGMFSMDTMGAIAIALLIMGVVAATFFGLKMKSKTTTAMNDLNMLQINTTSLKMANGGYGTGSLLSALNKGKMLPSNMVRSGDDSSMTARNVWGGAADVIGAGPYFEIHFDGIPTADCMQILPRTIEGGTYSKVVVGTTTLTQSSNQGDIQTACSGSSDKVSAVWTVED